MNFGTLRIRNTSNSIARVERSRRELNLNFVHFASRIRWLCNERLEIRDNFWRIFGFAMSGIRESGREIWAREMLENAARTCTRSGKQHAAHAKIAREETAEHDAGGESEYK